MSDENQVGIAPAPEPIAESQPSAEPSLPAEPAKSAREALQRAFAEQDADKPQDDSKPQGDRARDPATGKFVKADGQQETPQSVNEPVKPVEVEAKPQVDVPEWVASEARKAAWQGMSEEARTFATELYNGYEQHRGKSERYDKVARYDQMAEQSGTTLDKALENYVGIEQRLYQDPINGLLQICQNLGVNPQAVGQALMGVQPKPGAADSIEAATLNRRIAELEKQLNGKFGELEKERKMKQAEDVISSFAKDHPYFDDVVDVIVPMIERGYELSDAYDLAVRRSPEIVAKIEADKAAKAAPPKPDPAQTRKASLSISGSPTAGSNPAPSQPAASARDALKRSFASTGLLTGA